MPELRTASGVSASGQTWPGRIALGHPVALDGVEGALGVELLHHIDVVTPAAVRSHRPRDGRWYIGARLRYTESASIQGNRAVPASSGAASGEMWQFALNSLRSASRSRQVLQQVTLAFVLDQVSG